MAKNFGFNIGGGGIADLVAAPQVRPVATRIGAPVPTLRDRKEPEETLKGALLGALAPTGAKLGLAGLSKVPGLENLLFKPEPSDPASVKKVAEADYYSSPYERELSLAQDRLNKSMPLSTTPRPRQKTMFGSALSELLTYAPAALLDEDAPESMDQFLKTASASKKVGASLDEVKLEAYLKTAAERAKALTDVGDFTRKITNSAVPQADGTFKPFSREVLLSKDGNTAYIKSQNEKGIDIQIDPNGNEIQVPRGQYYVNPKYTLRDEEPGQTDPVKLMDMNDNGMPYVGYTEFAVTPEGRSARILVNDSRDNNKRLTIEQFNSKYGTNLVLFSGPEYQSLRAATKDQANPDLVKQFQGRAEKETALIEVANVATELLDIAMRAEKEEELITTAGGVATWYNGLYNNLNSLFNIFQGEGFKSVDEVVRAKQNGQSALTLGRLLDASNTYSQVLGNPNFTKTQQDAAKNALISALKVVRDEGKAQGSDASWLNLGDDNLAELVTTRGALVAGQLRLAYAAAAADGQTGTSLSDKDVSNFLEQVGFNSQEPFEIGTKISKFVKERLQTFDIGTFRGLSNDGRQHDQGNVARTDNYLVGTLRINPEDLAALRTVESGSEDERRLVNNIQRQINRITDGTAASDFVYDSVNKRYRYVPVLERLQKYNLIYQKYKQKYWPKYKITEEEINLDSGPLGLDSSVRVRPEQVRDEFDPVIVP